MKNFILVLALIIPLSNEQSKTGKELSECVRNLKGMKYVKGADGPNQFDEFGILKYCYEKSGMKVDFSKERSCEAIKKIAASKGFKTDKAQEGSLVFKKMKGKTVCFTVLDENYTCLDKIDSLFKTNSDYFSLELRCDENSDDMEIYNIFNESPLNDIAKCALNQIGKPYSYGKAGPDSFDNIGIIKYCYGLVGAPINFNSNSEKDFYKYLSGKYKRTSTGPGKIWTYSRNNNAHVNILVGENYICLDHKGEGSTFFKTDCNWDPYSTPYFVEIYDPFYNPM